MALHDTCFSGSISFTSDTSTVIVQEMALNCYYTFPTLTGKEVKRPIIRLISSVIGSFLFC